LLGRTLTLVSSAYITVAMLLSFWLKGMPLIQTLQSVCPNKGRDIMRHGTARHGTTRHDMTRHDMTKYFCIVLTCPSSQQPVTEG
jgi:hypothetical protein